MGLRMNTYVCGKWNKADVVASAFSKRMESRRYTTTWSSISTWPTRRRSTTTWRSTTASSVQMSSLVFLLHFTSKTVSMTQSSLIFSDFSRSSRPQIQRGRTCGSLNLVRAPTEETAFRWLETWTAWEISWRTRTHIKMGLRRLISCSNTSISHSSTINASSTYVVLCLWPTTMITSKVRKIHHLFEIDSHSTSPLSTVYWY